MKPDQSELIQQLKLDKSDLTEAKNGRSNIIWLMGAVVIILAGLGYWWVTKSKGEAQTGAYAASEQAATPATKASVESLNQQPSTPTTKSPPVAELSGEKILDASGYITARQIATVSAEVMGLITSVQVEEGMSVEQGQVLATIDDTKAKINWRLAEAQVQTQQARILSLKADLGESERELKRLQNLEQAGDFSSKAQLSRALATLQRFQAEIASAQAGLEVAQLQAAYHQRLVADHTITAPFSGVVTTKNAQAGEIVAPSAAGGGFTRTGICTIVDMNSLEIEVDVNEAYIGRVKSGQKVLAVLDAYPSWTIPARVIAVIPTANRAKATVRVRIAIEDKDSRILPDMGVKVSFIKED